MKIDLFELFEGLLEGTLHFFYNSVWTAWRVLRHPVAGPDALAREHAASREAKAESTEKPKGKPQMGGVTFLFVCYFALFLASDLLPGGTIAIEHLPRMFVAPGTIDVGPIWLPILAALAAAAVVDVLLRAAFFLLVEQQEPAERDEMVNRVEYALLWPLVAVTALVAVITFAEQLLGGRFPDLPLAVFFAGMVGVLLAHVPGAQQIRGDSLPDLSSVREIGGAVKRLYVPVFLLLAVGSAGLDAGLNVAAGLDARPGAARPPAAASLAG